MRVATSSTRKSQIVRSYTDDKGRKVADLVLRAQDYLFSQNTIVSSVSTEQNSHLIQARTSNLVNSNGETWTNESLKASYQTFIGAWNYLNHVQIPEKSIGFIGDAALRKIPLQDSPSEFVYYVDILVCTHRENTQIVNKIALGEIEYLSMGCDVLKTQCSRCGKIIDYTKASSLGDVEDICDHLLTQKGKIFTDRSGNQRVCAELLGTSEEGTCTFTEASFLTMSPAFDGAVKRNILPIKPEQAVAITVPEWALEKPAMQKYLAY